MSALLPPPPAPAPPPAPPVLGPPRPPWWPAPAGRVPWPMLLVAVLGGLLAALTLPGARAGLPLTVLLLAAAATVVRARHARDRLPVDVALVVPAVGLALVPALRAEALLVVMAALTCTGLLAVLALERTRWAGLAAAPSLLLAAAVRGVAWAAARPPVDVRRPRHPGAWAVGAGGALLLVVTLWSLLASADAAFARLLTPRLPDGLGWRVVLGVGVGALLLGLGTAAAPPARERLRVSRAASAVEWVLPLVGADAVLAAFLAVQAAVLVDPDAALAGTGVTPAAWAREGFGQLVVVTVLVLLTLGWAVRRSDPAVPGQRRLLRGGGGLLALLTLGLVAAALSRMVLYADRFGGTSMRLYVIVFELWLALVVVLVAVAWLTGRADRLPRLVVATAAWLLLALAAAGPEAVVARYDVERLERTGLVDPAYLATLSADAVPALLDLPPEERAVALGGREPHDDPWYAVNLSRLRADALLGG